MEILILASGSKGNATVINTNGQKLLVDIGISYLSINKKLTELNMDINNIDTLLITHEHSDHTKGLKTLLKKKTIKTIYLTRGTLNSFPKDVRELLPLNTIIIEADNFFHHKEVKVTPFLLSHDAKEPVGFIIESNNKKVVFLTDTGYVDQSYFELLSKADLYILEANHDPEMLMKSRRPFPLKQRIVSELGHLSNNEAAWLINEFKKGSPLTRWAIAHISEDCNTVYKIEEAIVKIVKDVDNLEVIYTSQDTSDKIILWLK